MRIIPAQKRNAGRCWTVVIPDHPYGITSDIPFLGLVKGDFIASWETREQAEVAAFILGLPLEKVYPSRILGPEL